ncbi:MAG: hypothetical protein PHD76_08905 [Methylacidiphilales bacterium]|nr:hypothetical protein [Candidatus Methylacidiphilales bacterium]
MKNWKAERLSSELFLGTEETTKRFWDLPERELVIVSSALIDVALTELLFHALRGSESERMSFFGVDGTAHAPLGTFGAKIQLAHLMGYLPETELASIRVLKKIRNHFAHRVDVSLSSDLIRPEIEKMKVIVGEKGKANNISEDLVIAVQHHPHRMYLLLSIIYQGLFAELLKKITANQTIQSTSLRDATDG